LSNTSSSLIIVKLAQLLLLEALMEVCLRHGWEWSTLILLMEQ